MVWPTENINESNLDQGSDSRAAARPDLLQCVQQVNAIRQARGVAGGIPQLDDDGLIPVVQIPIVQVMGLMQFVDGAGSGLDADLLDGYEGSQYVLTDGTNDINTPSTKTTGLVIQRRTTTNNARARAATVRSVNSPAATALGYGVEIRTEMGNAAGTTVSAGFIAWDWIDPTNGSEDAALVFGHMVGGALAEAMRIVDRKIQLVEQSATPTGQPPTGSWWIYPKAGGLALMDDAGSEALLTSGGATDHASLLNLTTGDPHTQYFRPDGARVMTADLPLGAHSILATDLGADPSAPSAGQVRLYTKSGQLYYRNSSAVVGPIITGGVTDHGVLNGLGDDDHPQYLLHQPTANVTLNNSGDDIDFVIKGTSAANLFTLDAGNNALGVNVVPGSSYRMEIVAGTGKYGLSVSASDQPAIQATSTTNIALRGSSTDRVLYGTRAASSTPANAMAVLSEQGSAGFRLLDLDGLTAVDLLRARVGSIEALTLRASEAVINDTGSNYDFRVESDTKSNMLFVDASADCVNINSTLNAARLSVDGDGQVGIYARTTSGLKAAIIAETLVSATFAMQAIAAVDQGFGLQALSTRELTAWFVKDLQNLSVGNLTAVLMEVVDVTDTARVLALKQGGSGDFLTCYDGSDVSWLQLKSSGGAYWKYMTGDMATPPTGMWGIFPKADGWYQISPAGDVSLLGGSGGGVVTSAAGAERRPDHYEELVATVSGATSVSTTFSVPAGAYIERVLVRTGVSVSGGYHVGVTGAEKRWGDAVGGNVGDTNLAFARTPAPLPTGDNAVTIKLTAAGGTFADSAGRIRVTAFFVRFTGATS